MNDFREDNLFRKLVQFPLFLRYLGPSLRERVNSADWFENRFIRDMYLDASFVSRYEDLLKKANIDTVKNSTNIFDTLKGNALDYDSELFDVFAEVRLICWARENNYTNIEKLVPSSMQTPDLFMEKPEVKTIAEAKHFRTRDYLLDFVYDRVGGLLVKTGQYRKINLLIETTPKYRNCREALVKHTAAIRAEHIRRAREEIQDSLFEKMAETGASQVDLLDGLISVKITSGKGLSVVPSVGWQNLLETSQLMIDKLKGNLYKALGQINGYKNTQNFEATNLNGLGFLSGTGPEEKEWDTMWDMLFKYKDNEVLERVINLRQEAQKMIEIPFELIVGIGNPLRYDCFPWPAN